ncbi:unnamed protein product [Debaryomyces tyrocola]|nr:unnamed protein product [Debaryomyces tyrocola]
MVSWSSWLWHLLNTQNVPSSILGEIIFLYLYILNFYCFIFNLLCYIDYNGYLVTKQLICIL